MPESANRDVSVQIAEAIGRSERFIVTAHIRADGDAIAAISFVSAVLRDMGKQVHAVVHDASVDARYDFIQGTDLIFSAESTPAPFLPDVTIVLDSPTLVRVGRVADIVTKCPMVICIDHHPGNDGFAHLNLIDTSASSTCEILARLSSFLNLRISIDMVNTLYAGIAFDTGNFRFSNTTGITLRTAATLLDMGANPEFISNQLFHKTSLLKLRAMAQTLQSIELHHRQTVAISHLPFAFFHSHPGAERELEGFTDLAISLDGVRIAVFLKEFDPTVFKASLRATESWDVGSVAEAFGGGGHQKASGCTLSGEFDDVVQKLLFCIRRYNPRL